jgi:hypothetical protein
MCMSTPCSTFTYPRRDDWAIELQGLVDKADLQQVVMTTKVEMMSDSPLPWPVTPYDEWAPEREMITIAECAAYEAKQYEKYGDDEAYVTSMMCNENEVDLRLTLWRANRVKELGLELRSFFELVDLSRFGDALHKGWWLLEQHDRYGGCFDPVLLRLLKETMAVAFEQNVDVDSSDERSIEIAGR